MPISRNEGLFELIRSITVAITREAGDHIVSTSMIPPDPCQVHEYEWFFKKNRLWLNDTGTEIQSRFEQSMILFKKPLFNIVRLQLHRRPSFWFNLTSYSAKLQRKSLLRRCFVRLPIFFWSWPNASSLCGLPPDIQQQRTDDWSCLRFISICLFSKRGHHLDSSLSTSQYQYFKLSAISFCSNGN